MILVIGLGYLALYKKTMVNFKFDQLLNGFPRLSLALQQYFPVIVPEKT